jgi:putative DNA primase/helicase
MRQLRISVGENFASHVSPLALTWADLVKHLSSYDRSRETLEQFGNLHKDDQLRAKDRGWWNGSHYSGIKRDAQQIEDLDVLALDVDNCNASTIPHITATLLLAGYTYFMGSTRKHTSSAPRLRLAFPLTRAVSVDESDAIKRKLAEQIGMPLFDTVSFRANQVMFWPTVCSDGEIFIHHEPNDGWLDPDAYLAANYADWHDRDEWPLHPKESRGAVNEKTGKRSNPEERDDIIGEWCRCFDVPAAMDKFIPGVYVQGSSPARYTHHLGSTTNGAVLYDDGLYLYSNHMTDPATGVLCNSWDLVRIHKFGELDAKGMPSTPIGKLPSQQAMIDFALTVPEVMQEQRRSQIEGFDELDEPTYENLDAPDEPAMSLEDLFDSLDKNKKGKVKATYDNLIKIFRHHPLLKHLAFNANIGATVWRQPMPWQHALFREQQLDETEGLRYRDQDDLHVREFIYRAFKGMELPSDVMIKKLVAQVSDERVFHPIRDSFNALPEWDGIPRVDTMLHRYCGTPNDEYHRGVSRKFLCGIVARALRPGCKFDYMPIFIGPQGQKKSLFFETLAGHPSWFTDNMPPVDKRADVVNAIRSKLIVEWAELDQLRKHEVESIRAFITVKVDQQRLSFERHTLAYKRQAIIVGTTNSYTPLRDGQGNRRSWPIVVDLPKGTQIDCAGLAAERAQLFAEAKRLLAAGEQLYLNGDALSQAEEHQEQARDVDPTEETIKAWLAGEIASTGTPPMDAGNVFDNAPRVRDRVCLRSIACEALGQSATGKDLSAAQRRLISDLMARHADYFAPGKPFWLKGYGPSRGWERRAGAPAQAEIRPVATVTALDPKRGRKKAALLDV